MISLTLNGTPQQFDVDPDMPLLWAIRDFAGLTGAVHCRGTALCGADRVHLDGQAVRPCVMPVSAAQGEAVTTLEGLDSPVAGALCHTTGRRFDRLPRKLAV